MQHNARTQTVIELITELEKAPHPADRVMHFYFKNHRYIGSKDRGAIAELVYTIIRHKGELHWHISSAGLFPTPRLYVISALYLLRDTDKNHMANLFNGAQYAPEPMTNDERRIFDAPPLDAPPQVKANVPEWLFEKIKTHYANESEALFEALMKQAPLDIRVNTLKTDVESMQELLADAQYVALPVEDVPNALRMQTRYPVFTLKEFQDGWFEVQDAGSQRIASLIGAKAGDRVLDFCAGAGGKTLALAAQMKNKGQIYAFDNSAKRLEELKKRLKRAGVDNVQVKAITDENDAGLKRHKAAFDWVVLDVPCSGSGTWRRSPDMKWKLTPEKLLDYTQIQQRILTRAALLVKPAGHLVYITCSLLPEENEQQIEAFLAAHPEFTKQNQMQLLPNRDETDDFYGAVLVKSA